MTIRSIKDINNNIATLIKNKSKEIGGDHNFEEYIKQFYNKVIHVDLMEKDHDHLFALVKSSYEFFQNHNQDVKIRIFNPTLKKDGWESENTVIEIVNSDMPFLVDSLTAEINRNGYKVERIINRVLKTCRNKSGQLTDIIDREADTDVKCGYESIIHFQISLIAGKERMYKLQANIEDVLSLVKISVDDWAAILERLATVRGYVAALGSKMKIESVAEIVEFLKWVEDRNFILLGFIEYSIKDNGDTISFVTEKNSPLGLMRAPNMQEHNFDDLTEISKKIFNPAKEKPFILDVVKSAAKSPIHRPVHMDNIRIQKLDKSGKVIGEYRFFGLFTSVVYYQDARLIPLIRSKIDYVLERANFSPSGHNGKELLAILEGYQREEVFQIDQEELFEICIGIVSLSGRSVVRLFARKDKFERFVSVICFIPRSNFSTVTREQIQNILATAFNGTISAHYAQVTDMPMARVHFIIKTQAGYIPDVNFDQLEKIISKVSMLWKDAFLTSLGNKMNEDAAEETFAIYQDAFPVSYRNEFRTSGTLYDIRGIEEAIKSNDVIFDLYEEKKDKREVFHLKIYNSTEQIELSAIMPILENFGLNVISEHTYLICPQIEDSIKNVWIHHFRFKVRNIDKPSLEDIDNIFEEAIYKSWKGLIENDMLNVLVMKSALGWRDIVILRGLSKYLQQTNFSYSYQFVVEALTRNYDLAKCLVELFYIKFNPDCDLDRDVHAAQIRTYINKKLTGVSNVADDSVIRKFVEVIEAILRTNFFQKYKEGDYKEYVSFKLDSSKIAEIPLPKPHAEIFVYSSRTEGVHLRGGEVARGGLRWSDRKEDFRTEVHGLVKAQMTKNAVIVPVGSKGGFVVKEDLEGLSRDEFMAAGIRSYKTFLSGLLDLTDNIVKNKIVPPVDVVRYDGDDPYLVVAADKGTATFSDIANEISAEYNFWLGDAFASGGSQGYDHKKMGITAKGAWVSVRRHFLEMGLDTQKEDFSVVGIGDMSGDVFGNGMLLSKHIKLIGAFNHMHIFIDPTPNAAKSFIERERLFKLPRSGWADYNTKLMSKGGGVFERSAKTIKITKQMKLALDIDDNILTPDGLIKALLKAPVALLWNGGIGTYIKAKKETHFDVNDKANNSLRINADELRCDVVGEGGNLGLTQKGRIEYAIGGGRINTDAIDNSAGVDCSDHEVNIKIALEDAVNAGKLSIKDRNALLIKMTDEVAALVLRDNRLQTQAISIAQSQGIRNLEQQARLIDRLEKLGFLNRDVEFLPDNEELAKRHSEGRGLTRPELSVLFAYSKLYLYQNLVESDLTEDEYYYRDLVRYFPPVLVSKFESEIANHKLRKEIIATVVTNSMVNRLGITFFNRLAEDVGMKQCDIARAYTIMRDSFKLREMWREIEALDGIVEAAVQIQMFRDIMILVERSTGWFLRNLDQPLNIQKIVDEFSPVIEEVGKKLDNMLSPEARELYHERYENYVASGVPVALAKRVSAVDSLASACYIVQVFKENDVPIELVAHIYFELGNVMHLRYLRLMASKIPLDSYWEKLSVKSYIDSLFDQQMRLTNEVVKSASKAGKDKSHSEAVEHWLTENRKQVERFSDLIEDIKLHDAPDFSMLLVAGHRIKEVSRN
jgi:glutamate dehydrogenase